MTMKNQANSTEDLNLPIVSDCVNEVGHDHFNQIYNIKRKSVLENKNIFLYFFI